MLVNYVNLVCPECNKMITIWFDRSIDTTSKSVKFKCKECGHEFSGMYDPDNWDDSSRSGLSLPGVTFKTGDVAHGNIIILSKILKGLDGVSNDDIIDLPICEPTNTLKFLSRMKDFDVDYKLWQETLKPLIENKCHGDIAWAEMCLYHKVKYANHIAKRQLKVMRAMAGFVEDICRSLCYEDYLVFETEFFGDISGMDSESIKLLIGGLRGNGLLFKYYRDVMSQIRDFIDLYPSLVLSESLLHTIQDIEDVSAYGKEISNLEMIPYVSGDIDGICDSYAKAFDLLKKIIVIPVCLTNISNTGSYKDFSTTTADLNKGEDYVMDPLKWFENLSVEDKKKVIEANDGYMSLMYLPDSTLNKSSITVSDIFSYFKMMNTLLLINEMIVAILGIELSE